MGMTLEEALAHGQGDERPFRCSEHDDHNASASVNVVKGVWHCYACNASGRIDGFRKPPDYQEILAAMAGNSPVVSMPEAWLDIFDAAGPSPYWEKRYGEEVARVYRTGTHPVTGNATYPVRSPQGHLWGVVQRNGTGLGPKYLYPVGVSMTSTLFNYPSRDKRIDVIVLVEGASDVMALHQTHRPRWRTVGCYGSGLHAAQTQLVLDLRPKMVIAAFDSDEAGMHAIESAHEALDEHVEVSDVDWKEITPSEANDPGDAHAAGDDPFLVLYEHYQGR
jgi:5S rRNA maturation endonuclease (ribonuclease M5)